MKLSIRSNHAVDKEMKADISGRGGADRVSLTLSVGGRFVSFDAAMVEATDALERANGLAGSRLRISHLVLLMCNVLSSLQDAVRF